MSTDQRRRFSPAPGGCKSRVLRTTRAGEETSRGTFAERPRPGFRSDQFSRAAVGRRISPNPFRGRWDWGASGQDSAQAGPSCRTSRSPNVRSGGASPGRPGVAFPRAPQGRSSPGQRGAPSNVVVGTRFARAPAQRHGRRAVLCPTFRGQEPRWVAGCLELPCFREMRGEGHCGSNGRFAFGRS